MELRTAAELLGSFGEFVGAIAVVLTLVYFAVQIRQNTGAVRAAALNAAITSLSNVREAAIVHLDVATLFRVGTADPDRLSDDDRERFRLLIHSITTAIWNVYAQSKYVGLSEDIWETQKITLSRIINTTGGTWFWENFRNEFEQSFQLEVDEITR
jgi:hypothetical protein